jgi:drug/metabolite transporter (DMT)-like permease
MGRRSMLTWADAGVLLAVLVWGLNFPALKHVMTEIDPLAASFIRGVMATALLGGILLARRRWRWPEASDWGGLLTVGLLGVTLNQVLYSWGLHLTSASHSGLIFTLTPLVVFAIGHVRGTVTVDRLDVVGLALGLAGALLILVGSLASTRAGTSGGPSVAGDLLTVGAAATWAVWTIMAAPILQRAGTFLGTVWITGVGTAGLLPLALPGLVHQTWSRVSGTTLLLLLFAAFVAGALGSLLWYAGVRRLGPARTAIYANLESFFAVVAAAVILGERIEWPAIVGGLGVVAGVLLTRRSA